MLNLFSWPIDLVAAIATTIFGHIVRYQFLWLGVGIAFVAWNWYETGSLEIISFYEVFAVWDWHPILQVLGGWLLVGSTVSVILRLQGTTPIDSNIYFDVNLFTCGPNSLASMASFGLWTPPVNSALAPENFVDTYKNVKRLKVLVLNSKYFDEALLALSAAPVVSRYHCCPVN